MATTKKVATRKVSRKKTVTKTGALQTAKKKTTRRKTRKTTKRTTKKTTKKGVQKVPIHTRKKNQKISFDEKLAKLDTLHAKKQVAATSHEKEKTALSRFRIKKPVIKESLHLAVLSPYRFPVSIDTLAVQTARFGGVAFVVLGGIFALNFAQYIWSDTEIIAAGNLAQVSTVCDEHTMSTLEYQSCVNGQALLDATAQSDGALENAAGSSSLTLSQTSEENNEALLPQECDAGSMTAAEYEACLANGGVDVTPSSVNTDPSLQEREPPAVFELHNIDTTNPVAGLLTGSIYVENATRVKVFLTKQQYSDKTFLGLATRKQPTEWTFSWDTTKWPDSEYRISAEISNVYNPAPDSYSQSHTEYIEVNNSTDKDDQSIDSTTPQGDVTPPVQLQFDKQSPIAGDLEIEIGVADASKVLITAVEKASGSSHTFNAKQVRGDLWSFTWQTQNFNAGVYDLSVRVTNAYGSYVDADTQKQIIVEKVSDAEPEVAVASPVEQTETELPAARIDLTPGMVLSDFVTVVIETDNARRVELYAKPILASTPWLLGTAVNKTAKYWSYAIDTSQIPNGDYSVYAVAKGEYGSITSPSVRVSVSNHSRPYSNTEAQESQIESVREAALVAGEKPHVVIAPVSSESATSTPSVTASSSPSFDFSGTSEEKINKVFAYYAERIHAELKRFAAAQRSHDETKIIIVHERLRILKEEMQKLVHAEDDRVVLQDEIGTRMDVLVEKYAQDVTEVDSLIAQRVSEDVFKDSDNDTISDFDEVTIYSTDPFSADSDGDGFNDDSEIINGYDPTDPTPEVAVRHESPKEKGVVRNDILAVESIETVVPVLPKMIADEQAVEAVITGRGLPNSFVTVYIFSTPIVVTVKTDDDGSWRYRFDKELEDGEHSVYVGVTDNAGRIVAKSEPFAFVKDAQAFSPVESAVTGVTEAATEDDSLLSDYMVYLILSISVVSIGLVLILLGLHLDARQRRFPEVVTKDV